MRAPIPANEPERLRTLRRYRILDSPAEMSYDDLTLLASKICSAPIAAISLVDSDRQWFKSITGLEVEQTSRDVAFCAHAILRPEETLVVEDATQDVRFSDNALVTSAPHIRFYAGTPLVVADGSPIGTLCVIDTAPRRLTTTERQALEALGRQVVAQLELRRNIKALGKTVRKLARKEAQLHRTQQRQLELKDQFISHVSHELRSPLTPIHQFVTILLDEIGGPLTADQREYLNIVHRNAGQLRQMIGDLLEVTRARTGKLKVDRRRVRVDTIVQEVVNSSAVTARAAQLELSAAIDGALPDVIGDVVRVRQILANLVDNAMKFTPAGGSVTVRAAQLPEDPGAVCITVRDTGCGLSPDDCDRVFEHLYQVNDTSERSRNGLGMGLYIAKQLVRAMGGRIWVDSEFGAGSAFSFTLPVFSLQPLLTPLLTSENLQRETFALIRVEMISTTGDQAAARAVPVATAALEAVSASIHPSMDVILPQSCSSQPDDALTIVAMTHAAGAAQIVRRLEERLGQCAAQRTAGVVARIRHAVFDLPKAEHACPAETAARMAQIIDRCTSGLPSKEMQ
jgi:signal transduction histidine kinase